MDNIVFLILIYFFNFLLIINIIFKKNRNPHNTLAWFMFLIIFPVIGFLIYLFFGRNIKFDTSIKRKNVEDKKIDNEVEKILNKNICNCFIKVHENKNNVNLFYNGKDKFNCLFNDIENAKQFIHVQYYIFKNDEIGNKLIQLLNKKSNEGVQIKVLLDYMGTIKTKKTFLNTLNKNFCISYFKLNFFSRFNTHNHRKVCIVDGKIAYIGGLNVGDEYLGLSSKFKFWRDLHIRIEGDAVYEIQKNFIKDWNFANKYKKNQLKISKKIFPTHYINNICTVHIFTSGVDSRSYIYFLFNYLITSAKKNIYIETPYFIPNETIIDNLKIASLRGVDIKIIVPKEKDHPFVKYANTAYFNELINTNIEMYHYELGFLHSKLIIIDNEICSIGSANMDYRSLKINFEISSFIYNKGVAKDVTKHFFNDLRSSKQYEINSYNNRSFITKSKENIAKLLSPLL